MKTPETLNVLIVDDHQVTIEGHISILKEAEPEFDGLRFAFDSAKDCDTAWEKMKANPFHVVILDMSFPHSASGMFASGEELGKKVKQEYPGTKTIILTGTEEAFQLNNVMRNVLPEGFLLKTQTDPEDLVSCMKNILRGNEFYSPAISKLLKSRFQIEYHLDEVDKRILQQLSLGTKTKDLPKYVFRELRTVETRKKHLKEIFDAKDNEELLRKAREAGFL